MSKQPQHLTAILESMVVCKISNADENTGNLIYVENSYAWAQELENNNNNNIKRSWLDVQRITLISGVAFIIVLLGKIELCAVHGSHLSFTHAIFLLVNMQQYIC